MASSVLATITADWPPLWINAQFIWSIELTVSAPKKCRIYAMGPVKSVKDWINALRFDGSDAFHLR
jgi:hypothetical protein